MRALLTTAVIIMAVSEAALAADALPSRQGIRDNSRCTALAQQFERTTAQRTVDEAAKKQAAQGEADCQTGRFSEGIAALEKAVQMIGENPGK